MFLTCQHQLRALIALCALAALLWLASAIWQAPRVAAVPHFATITVNTTTDEDNTGASCSLREAIIAANTNAPFGGCPSGAAGLDNIVFNLGAGTPSIAVTGSPLPPITEAVSINGNTGGATRVELDGTDAEAFTDGLTITASGSTISSLVINHFGDDGIAITGEAADNNVVQNSYIGTNAAGTAARGNEGGGVFIGGGADNNTIGGTGAGARNVISGNDGEGIEIAGSTESPTTGNKVSGNYLGLGADGTTWLGNSRSGVQVKAFTSGTIIGGTTPGERNVISANDSQGIVINGANATGIQVRGNFIGTDAGGTFDRGNGDDGVSINNGAHNNIVGGTTTGAGNLIFGNDGDGVDLDGNLTVNNSILGNSILNNAAEGIDLADDLTPNDALDPDTGPNNLQNYPVLTCAQSGTMSFIGGSLNSLPATTFRIEFFANNACDTDGLGEGQRFLGFQNVTTDALGNAIIAATVPAIIATGELLTATATRLDAMSNPTDTSEFSACLAGPFAAPIVTINDASLAEGNAGTTNFAFTVTVSNAVGGCGSITVNYATQVGTAAEPADFTPTSGALTFNPPFIPNTQAITVPVGGELLVEANETLFVNLTATNATVTAGQGQGTITNDDFATISINDVSQPESQTGTRTFTVTLSQPSSEQVAVNFVTADGTATAGTDYVAAAGTLIFAPGVTAQPINITVNGDLTLEANETFFVNLSTIAGNNVNVPDPTFAKAQGQGTILNDDAQPPGLTVSIADPFACTGPGQVLLVTALLTNPNPTAQTATFTATLPAGLVGVPGTGTSTVGATPTVLATTATFTASLAAGQTATLTYQVQVGDLTSGATLCISSTISLQTGFPTTVQACTMLNCPPLGPGLPFPSASEVSDQKAGSVLVYNLYSSSAAAPNSQNTRLAITNTSAALDIAVHLFFVDGETCSIADAIICLTKNQTAAYLASDLDPGTTGYLVAVASDLATGCPVNFNFLVGDAHVKLASGHQANLGAETFAALPGQPVACDGSSLTAQLNFDGVSYNRAPRTLAASSIPGRKDGNDTLLVVNRFGGNLTAGAGTLTDLLGLFYDDAENAVSFTLSPSTCQFRSSLSNKFPRTTPRLDSSIPAGRTGWLRLYSASDIGLLGAVLNFNPNAQNNAGAFNQGRNLHKLTLTSTQTLVIPIFPPNCLD